MTQSGGGGGGVHHHLNHHGLCCLSAAALPAPDAPPTPEPRRAARRWRWPGAPQVDQLRPRVAERWFSLHDGVLSYSKIRRDASAAADEDGGGGGGEVRLIGGASARIGGARRPDKPVGVVCLKVTQSSPAISQIMFFFFPQHFSVCESVSARNFLFLPLSESESIKHQSHFALC